MWNISLCSNLISSLVDTCSGVPSIYFTGALILFHYHSMDALHLSLKYPFSLIPHVPHFWLIHLFGGTQFSSSFLLMSMRAVKVLKHCMSENVLLLILDWLEIMFSHSLGGVLHCLLAFNKSDACFFVFDLFFSSLKT